MDNGDCPWPLEAKNREEWKLRISDLVERYQSKQEKALEIADAIGIELEVRIRR